MKNLLYLIAGISAAAAYYLATTRASVAAAPQPVEELAHKLQDAWADHHTVV